MMIVSDFAPVELILNSVIDDPIAPLQLDGRAISPWRAEQRSYASQFRDLINSSLSVSQYAGSLVDAESIESFISEDAVESESAKVLEYGSKVSYACAKHEAERLLILDKGKEKIIEILTKFDALENSAEEVKNSLAVQLRQFVNRISELSDQGVTDEETSKKEKEREEMQRLENEDLQVIEQINNKMKMEREILENTAREIKDMKQTASLLQDQAVDKISILSFQFGRDLNCLTWTDEESDKETEFLMKSQSLESTCDRLLSISQISFQPKREDDSIVIRYSFPPPVPELESRDPWDGPRLKYIDVIWSGLNDNSDDMMFKVDLSIIPLEDRKMVWDEIVKGVKPFKEIIKNKIHFDPSNLGSVIY